MRILVVDDDYATRLQLRTLLSQHGDCDTAPDGEIAFRMFLKGHSESMPYRLVTLDIEMPGEGGHQTLQRIRQWEDTHGIATRDCARILMCTVRGGSKDVFSSFREGCEGYLLKPVGSQNLAEALSELDLPPLQPPEPPPE